MPHVAVRHSNIPHGELVWVPENAQLAHIARSQQPTLARPMQQQQGPWLTPADRDAIAVFRATLKRYDPFEIFEAGHFLSTAALGTIADNEWRQLRAAAPGWGVERMRRQALQRRR